MRRWTITASIATTVGRCHRGRSFMNALLRRICTGTMAASVAGFMLAATPAYAVHDDGLFQLDGNVNRATCGVSFPGYSCPPSTDDWDNLYSCPNTGAVGSGCTKSVPGIGNSASAIADLITDVANASIFTTGGSKDENDIT